VETFLSDRLRLYRGLIPPAEAAAHLHGLLDEIVWLSPFYDNPGGKRVHLPRLTASYGEESYDYSALRFTPQPWTPRLLTLRTLAEDLAGEPMNTLVLQRYRDGADRLGWHADDSPRLGPRPSIVSISLGASRDFEVRHRQDRTERLCLPLHCGDVLVMRQDMQQHYQHRVPSLATADAVQERINLTFRRILISSHS
jgi:alkylated DNA repair dioxygenase AlkB